MSCGPSYSMQLRIPLFNVSLKFQWLNLSYMDMEEQIQNQVEAIKVTSMVSLQNPVSEIEEIEDGIDVIYKQFKRFDVVFDPLDHHFFTSSSLTKRKKSGIAKIDEEWKDLGENLPESIYVRGYRGRIDLMRAVIVGSPGTPYQNGLFFIDIQFPCNYPTDPPKLYFHSHGLGLNPNLRRTGKICFSHGKIMNERWNAGSSSILRLLYAIRDLILNESPYFNQPGDELKDVDSPQELKKSLDYNKEVKMLCFKAMLNTMAKPPIDFVYFVAGHFRRNSHKILMDCKECLEGDESLDSRIFMELVNAFETKGCYCKHFYGYVKKIREAMVDIPATASPHPLFKLLGFN